MPVPVIGFCFYRTAGHKHKKKAFKCPYSNNIWDFFRTESVIEMVKATNYHHQGVYHWNNYVRLSLIFFRKVCRIQIDLWYETVIYTQNTHLFALSSVSWNEQSNLDVENFCSLPNTKQFLSSYYDLNQEIDYLYIIGREAQE